MSSLTNESEQFLPVVDVEAIDVGAFNGEDTHNEVLVLIVQVHLERT